MKIKDTTHKYDLHPHLDMNFARTWREDSHHRQCASVLLFSVDHRRNTTTDSATVTTHTKLNVNVNVYKKGVRAVKRE